MRGQSWIIVVSLVMGQPQLLLGQTDPFLPVVLENVNRRLRDRLMDEPTPLSEFASAAGATIEVVGSPETIGCGDSSAEIAAITVTDSSGAREVGIRIALGREGSLDTVYLDLDQARRIRSEFMDFVRQDPPSSDCSPTDTCHEQPLRCFRIQPIIQAICGSIYSVRNREEGVALRTPRGEFRFPSVRAIELYEAFDLLIPLARRASRE